MHRKTRDLILKITILLAVMGAGYHTSAITDPGSSIAYARSVYKTTQSITLRSGRSSSRSAITKIPGNRAVNVLEVYDGGAWAKIRWNGYTGYIHTMYLKLTKVSDSTSASSSSNSSTSTKNGKSYQADGYHMYVSQPVTLRKTASSSSSSLGTVQTGDDVLLINKKGTWYQVRHKGRYGWLPIKYVKDYAANGTVNNTSSTSSSKSSSSSSSSTTASSSKVSSSSSSGKAYQSDGYHMVTTSQVNLRAKASSSSNRLTALSKGTDVLLIDQSGSWYKVYVNKRYGYVHKNYLGTYGSSSSSGSSSQGSSSAGSSSGSSSSNAIHTMTTTKSAKLLYGPNYDFKTLSSVKKGEKVTVLDDWGYFVKVTYKGKTGYIHMNKLKKDKGYTSPGSKSSSSGSSSTGSTSGNGVSSSNKTPNKATRSNSVKINMPSSYSNKDIPVKGSVNNASVSKVEIFLNGTYLDRARISGSSYSYTIPSQVTRPGKNDIRVEASTGKGIIYQTTSIQVNKVPTIVIDPGHGGNDPGAIGKHNGKQYYEKDYDIKFAKNLQKELEKMGFRVIMTRSTDKWVENSDRVRIAKDYDADLLFSMHHNATRNNTASGGLSIYPSMKYNPSTQASFTESRELAEMLASAYKNSGMSHRGAYRDIDISGHTLYIMRNAPMRTIMTEMGFITSKYDINKITSSTFQATLPKEIARQIYRFFYNWK